MINLSLMLPMSIQKQFSAIPASVLKNLSGYQRSTQGKKGFMIEFICAMQKMP